MKTLDALLTEAEAQPAPHKDVTVCLDAGIAKERERLLDALSDAEKQDADDMRLAAANDAHTAPILERLQALEESVKDAMRTFRFRRMPGEVWADLTSRNPARIDVPLDLNFGYNYDAVCKAAAIRSGVIVDGDDEAQVPAPMWERLFAVLSGHEVEQIRDAVWTLNEYEPAQRIEALVKGFGAATRSAKK